MRSQAPRQEGSKILRSKQIRNGREVPGEWHVQSARCQGDRRRVARARWGQQRAQGGAQEEQVKQWPQSDVTGQDRSARPSRLARDLICFCVSCTPSCRPVLARPRCLSTPPRTPPPRRALRCRPCATPSRYISPSALLALHLHRRIHPRHAHHRERPHWHHPPAPLRLLAQVPRRIARLPTKARKEKHRRLGLEDERVDKAR